MQAQYREHALPKTDKFLVEYKQNSVSHAFDDFQSKGGRLYRFLGQGEAPFQLRPGDVVFPSCSSGENRSQTVWAILKGADQNIELMPPHGARGGYDPYYGSTKRWRDPSRDRVPKADGFFGWSNLEKVARFGEENVKQLWEPERSPEALDKMKQFFSAHYYKTDVPADTRRIYITFQENAHVHLFRLAETNESLENVVVLDFVFPTDPLKCPATKLWWEGSRSVDAYVHLSEILNSGLDLSQVINTDKI